MLSPAQKKHYLKEFATVESSFRIEGMDPSGDAIYESAKEQILNGSMTPEQALAYAVEQTHATQRKVAS
jgi:hypothetical protein